MVAPPSESSEEEEEKEQVSHEDADTLDSWTENGPLKITNGMSTILACLLPVIAISVLSQIHGMGKLLSCLAGFAVAFTIILMVFTQGTSTRTEIFAATAA